ncbi:serine protease [Pseudonocardiaceae bacterium YIM PH 21723]|nr:serine protease [Pseudonocardiaceae bacterium YIM PH 21723]
MSGGVIESSYFRITFATTGGHPAGSGQDQFPYPGTRLVRSAGVARRGVGERSMKSLLLAAGLVLITGCAASAESAAIAVDRYRLAVTEVDGGASRSAQLTCDPVGGDHPRASDACADLAAANGDIGKIPETLQGCTREYQPVIATAYRNGKKIFEHEYPTRCVMLTATGAVFAF